MEDSVPGPVVLLIERGLFHTTLPVLFVKRPFDVSLLRHHLKVVYTFAAGHTKIRLNDLMVFKPSILTIMEKDKDYISTVIPHLIFTALDVIDADIIPIPLCSMFTTRIVTVKITI